MSQPQTPEYGILAQASELLLEEDLEKLIREKHKIDFIFYEDLGIAPGDPSRHTAVLIAPHQAEVIDERKQEKNYAWLYHQYPLADGSVFSLELPIEKGSRILQCLEENPFRGTGSTQAEALKSAYQEWVLFMNKDCPTDAPAVLNEVILASHEQIRTQPRASIFDFQKLQKFGRTSLKNNVETEPKFH